MSNPDSVSFPIVKRGTTVQVSQELLPDTSLRMRFPRRHHTIEHPPTDVEKAAYKAFKRRWKKMEKAREAIIREGERLGWATDDSGYEYEPAELLPLDPRTETVYDESKEFWHARLSRIQQHYQATGEWLEEPVPVTLMDLIAHDLAVATNLSVLTNLATRRNDDRLNDNP